jgi:hypothetical protein
MVYSSQLPSRLLAKRMGADVGVGVAVAMLQILAGSLQFLTGGFTGTFINPVGQVQKFL